MTPLLWAHTAPLPPAKARILANTCTHLTAALPAHTVDWIDS